MNRIIVALLCFSVLYVQAQFTTRELPSSTSAAPKSLVFDSLDGMIRNNEPQQYVGQEIFFVPKKVTAEGKGSYEATYEYIYTQLPKGYKTQTVKNTYMPVAQGDKARTSYNAVAGKYFKIIEVLDKTEISPFEGGGLFVKLEERESKDVVYFDIYKYKDSEQYRYAEYIIAGTFIKLQQRYLKQVFFLRDNEDALKEINTGEMIPQRMGDEWQCTDVTFTADNGEYRVYSPTLIFKNKEGKEVAYVMNGDINMNRLARIYMSVPEKAAIDKAKASSDSLKAAQSKLNAERNAKEFAQTKAEMISKYGEKYGTLIAENKVAIGMTKTMCVLAWGQPTNVNTTTTANGSRDQYVYREKGAYLYFENGKLVTIQQ